MASEKPERPNSKNDSPDTRDDNDLKMVLAAFGDDVLSLLDDDDDDDDRGDSELSVDIEFQSNEDVEAASAVQQLIESWAEKLNENANLFYAGSIALTCSEAVTMPRRTESRFLVFSVGEQRFGLPLKSVLEVANCGDITDLPRTHSWLRGVTILRGNLVSVTDLSRLFEGPAPVMSANKLIIVNSLESFSTSALLVDRIHGIRQLDRLENEQENPTEPCHPLTTGTANIDDRPVTLIDPDRLLGCPELSDYMK